jgi:ribosomal-protein-alanine N-acetyltransferase
MPGFEELHLLNLTVAPKWQRQGHGQAMLRRLCEVCRERGDPMLWLEVRQSNAVARQLYERFGFETVGLRRGYYPDLQGRREDAVVMRLSIEGSGHALD